LRQRSFVRLGAALFAASLALTACGDRSDDDGGDAGSTGGTGGEGKTVKLGVIAPLSGDLSALGLGIQNSVQLAVDQANEDGAVEGWTFELDAQDDQANPDVGTNVATDLASDPDVLGVVGTLNSSVAQSVQPVLDSANILMVSPANTNPTLTQGADPASPQRPYASYFRTATTDAIQGPFAARYVYETLGFTQVATINDGKTYGQGLVDAFTEEFTTLGGTVTTAQTINPDDTNFSPVISTVAPTGPQLVYYGGEYPQAGPLSQQMGAAGANIPLMGGDGIYSGQYPTLGGREGDLATSVGAPTAELESAADFVSAYEAAGFEDDYEAYGAYAYDAAQAIIEAAKTCLADADSVEAARPDCVEAMSDVSFDGVTGAVAFDEFGDTTTKVLTVYRLEGGAWVAAETGEFE
jgi:branched-chain amino acid transport system substrate-binding protein